MAHSLLVLNISWHIPDFFNVKKICRKVSDYLQTIIRQNYYFDQKVLLAKSFLYVGEYKNLNLCWWKVFRMMVNVNPRLGI